MNHVGFMVPCTPRGTGHQLNHVGFRVPCKSCMAKSCIERCGSFLPQEDPPAGGQVPAHIVMCAGIPPPAPKQKVACCNIPLFNIYSTVFSCYVTYQTNVIYLHKKETIVNTKDGYGTFGNLSKIYDEIRPSMPNEVIDDFFSQLSSVKPNVLDLGCGTGIITRQLAVHGAVLTGTDNDLRMIIQAEQIQNENINYVVAGAEKLPFFDSSFDAVTAYSSFHWFTNKVALKEIQRVLRNKGVFFVANRNKVGEIRKKYLNIFRFFMNKPAPDAKNGYNPAKILEMFGFVVVEEKRLPVVEHYTIEKFLAYMQSISMWNLVPDLKKAEALSALSDLFEKCSLNGYIECPVDIQTVIALKR